MTGARVAWYGRRLQAMTPAEVTDRVRRTLAHRTDAALYTAAPGVWRRRWRPDARSLLVSELSTTPRGLLVAERAQRRSRSLPRRMRGAGPTGRHHSREKVSVLRISRDSRRRSRRGTWTPSAAGAGPASTGSESTTGATDRAIPKWIWELNRCQDLPLLVAAMLVSGDQRYAEVAASRLESWIETHPPGRGIAWSNGFEAGMRAISLAVAFDGLRGSEHLSRERAEQIACALWQAVRWIERDPSTGSSANNHRLGELVGVLAVSALVPELEGSERRLEQRARGARRGGRAPDSP